VIFPSLVRRRRPSLRMVWLLCAGVSACAPKAPILPAGGGTPFPEFASAFEQATSVCRAVKTITTSMAISGRAGSTKLRGRIDAGLAAPARARLEGIAPFGKPVFVLVADGGRGTLVLPREARVLSDAPPDRIVEALAGVPLGPEELRTAISGCGLDAAPAAAGQAFPNGWVSGASGGSTVYLRPAGGGWQIAAATRGPLTLTYADYAGGRPSTIHLQAAVDGRQTADLTLRLSDVEINATLDPKAFDVDLPEHPVPLTLEELRRAGPLGRQLDNSATPQLHNSQGTPKLQDPKCPS
jgi:outer membrane lipoprotein-sorting protein